MMSLSHINTTVFAQKKLQSKVFMFSHSTSVSMLFVTDLFLYVFCLNKTLNTELSCVIDVAV